jgi:hypothetical protein
MIFYASWTTRDPIFQDFDPEACILVSPGGVPRYWSVDEWNNLPKKLFIDSGIFSNTKLKNQPSCQDILLSQLRIAKGWPERETIYFAHPDLIIPLKADFFTINRLIKKSIERSKIYFDLAKKSSRKIAPIGVIHGFDEETIYNSFEELISFGYKIFALGSLAIRFSNYRDKCLKVINTALRYEIKPLHLFGITCPLHNVQIASGIDSYDSSSPVKLAFYGTVLYGPPLKRYVLSPTSEQTQRDLFFNFRESLPKPLPCQCPICIDDKSRLLPVKGKKAKHDRAIHNYFQLKWATKKIY